MFTQRLSMDCTKEQYEKYLKDELLKMGYQEMTMYWGMSTPIFTNATSGITGYMIDINEDSKERHNRTYLGSFNAPLFLALAAMTDNPDVLGYGEYVTREIDDTLVRNEYGGRKIYDTTYHKSTYDTTYHKSTREEIIDWFKDDIQDLSKSPIYFHRNQSGSNDGLRVQNIDLAIKILKSKGYKILKPKTWEEV